MLLAHTTSYLEHSTVSDDQRPPETTSPWTFVRLTVAAILLFAAISKAWTVVAILQGDGLLSQRFLLLAAILWEAGLAAYLVLGSSCWSWRLTVITFCGFAAAAGYALATGRDCNCISQQITPQYMLALDIGVLVAVFWSRPHQLARRMVSNRLVAVLLSASVGFAALAGAIVIERRTDTGDPLKFILADMLRNESWPIDSRFHSELSPLESGRWLVMIGRHDCKHCRELIGEYFADPAWHRDGERTAFFLAGNDSWPFQLDRVSFAESSDHTIKWPKGEPFVASPAIFLLEDGTVVDAVDGSESDAFVENLIDFAGTSD